MNLKFSALINDSAQKNNHESTYYTESIDKQFKKDAIIAITQGAALINFDGNEFSLQPDDVLYLHAGLNATIKKSSDELRFITIHSGTKTNRGAVVYKNIAKIVESSNTKIYEYGGSDSLDIALAEIKTDYPGSNKWAVNTQVNMMYIIMNGKGELELKYNMKAHGDEVHVHELKPGKYYAIPRNVQYRLKVTQPIKAWIPSSPAWNYEQYRIIE